MDDLADSTKSINDQVAQIKVINPTSFYIDIDVWKYGNYEGNGVAK